MSVFVVALLVVLAACAATALAAPLRVDLELDVADEPFAQSVRVHARWLWLTWRSGQARRARPERPPRPRPRPRSRPAGRPRRRRVLAALSTPGFLRRVGRLAVELWRTLAPRTVDGWVRFGLDDPASTGVLCGAVQGAGLLARGAAWNVRLEPDFAGPAFSGHARCAWEVRPGAVLWPVGTFVVSPATWRAAYAALRAR